ncbi:glycosyltransferase [Planotetraspora sp. GP83]|uniref:glycosyltransferase n=1 Tax=Planotetraspora sp. GP83 TaxID=3156264 RepID=UPI003514212E
MLAFGLCLDEAYLLPGLVAVESLAGTLSPGQRRRAAIRVLTLDLSRQHGHLLAQVCARAGFGSFDLAWASPMAGALMPDDDYISVTAYLRFAFTEQFVGRPYLIYVDADTLPVDDITPPLHTLSGRLGLVVDEFNPAVGRGHALPGLAEDRPDLAGRPYFNGGMWWAPTRLLHAVRDGVVTALADGGRYIYHNDQDALNLWALQTGTPIATVEPRFNSYELGRFLERSNWVRRYTTRAPLDTRAGLLHYVGSRKPWHPTCPGTEGVRLWRAHAKATARTLLRLGDHSIPVPRWSARGRR